MDSTTQELQRELPRLLPRLWRFAIRLTRESADAEDLVQRCCLRALERRQQFREGTALLSWLFSIMHSIWLNELRARSNRRRWTIEWEEEVTEQCPDVHAIDPADHALYREVVASVEALPQAQRDVMLLVAVEGLSYKQAAEVLSVPVGTVMSRLARARLVIGEQFRGALAVATDRSASAQRIAYSA